MYSLNLHNIWQFSLGPYNFIIQAFFVMQYNFIYKHSTLEFYRCNNYWSQKFHNLLKHVQVIATYWSTHRHPDELRNLLNGIKFTLKYSK